jgi:hypothetical protein
MIVVLIALILIFLATAGFFLWLFFRHSGSDWLLRALSLFGAFVAAAGALLFLGFATGVVV